MSEQLEFFPYGAQYYRTPNPPESDWERDLGEMKRRGMSIVKLWAMWNYMHPAEGEFDYGQLDSLFDICEDLELKVLVQVILENAPYWLVQKYPDARYIASDGQKIWPISRPNTPGGGWPGLCLDNVVVREKAAGFVSGLADRYRGHPALFGYDAWNEVWFELHGYIGPQNYCYCDGTIAAFRAWLANRYGDIGGLSAAWSRRYTDWEQVLPPRHWGGYPDWLDWIKFRIENQGTLLSWRVERIREADPECTVVSHGLPMTVGGMATLLTDDWRNAERVDVYGLSSFPLWFGWDDVETFRTYDMVRCSSRGKRFWAAEMQAGPSGEGLVHSASPHPKDIRLWNWMALAAGATGVLYWQWRPELLGPESPGFGLTNLDGSPCDRTAVASEFAAFTSSRTDLFDYRPVKGEIAIAVLPESQMFTYISDRKAEKYVQAVRGAHRAFAEVGYQVDFAKVDDLDGYRLVYLPFPLEIESETARKLRDYVENGGILISEACPALFGDHGYVQIPNPGYGLDKVFGVTAPTGPESISEPAPRFVWAGKELAAVVHCQRLAVEGGRPMAGWPGGGAAMVENEFGRGKAVIIGTYPGISCDRGCKAAGKLLVDLAAYLGVLPNASSGHSKVWVRLHWHESAAIAYVVNMADADLAVTLALAPELGVRMLRDAATSEAILPGKIGFSVHVAARDARIFHLVRAGASEASLAGQLSVRAEG